MKRNFFAVLSFGAIVLFALAVRMRSAPESESGGTISGEIRDASGKPAIGASVRIRNADRGVTFLVFTGQGGHYSVSHLPPGKYSVQAAGGGFRGDSATGVQVAGGGSTKTSLTLNVPQEPEETMTIARYAASLPEGEGKLMMVSLCTGCHRYGLKEIISARKNGEGWKKTYERMSGYGPIGPMTDSERDRLIDYLAKNFGPDATPSLLAGHSARNASWVTGEAAKAVITEFDLPAGAYTHDVAVDSKGNAWLCERNTGYFGRFDPNSLTYTRIAVPIVKWGVGQPTGFSLNAIAVDGQDRVWLTDASNSRLVEYDSGTGRLSTYTIPKPPYGSANANTIRFHPNGTVWLTELSAGQILRFDPLTKTFTEFPVPRGEPAAAYGTGPYGMALGGDNMMWFVETITDRVSRIEPATGEIVQYSGPERRSVLKRMGADAGGNLWFGEYGGIGKLGRVDYRTGKIAEYATPTRFSGAYSVDVDRQHNLVWVNEMMADQIARFDPRTQTFVEYPLPTRFSSVRRIEIDPKRPNRIWYTGWYSDSVGYLEWTE